MTFWVIVSILSVIIAWIIGLKFGANDDNPFATGIIFANVMFNGMCFIWIGYAAYHFITKYW